MNTLVNTVFKSKMKTANTRFEDKYQKIKKCGNARKARLSDDLKTIMRGSTLCTTCGEHIVHIDGVTGSSPVATTNPRKSLRNQGLSSFLSSPPGCSNPPRKSVFS